MGIFDVFNLLDKSKHIKDQQIYNERIRKCNHCPLLTNMRRCGNGITSGCGCYIDQKAKLKSDYGGKCPLNKW